MDMDTFMTNETRNYFDDDSFSATSMFNKTRGILNDVTMQNKTMLLSNTMIEKQSGIYPEFKFKTNDYLENSIDLIELVKSYEHLCENQLIYMKKYSQTVGKKKQLGETNEVEDLENEIQVWKLFGLLYEDHLKYKSETMYNTDAFMESDMNHNEIFKNEAKLARKLTQNNSLLRRLKIIIDWLEDTFKGKYLKESPSFVDKYTNWEHTLHQLNSERKMLGTRDYIDELDPDAPIRLRKPLHDLDQEDEYCLLEYLYKLVRAGDLKAVKEICLKTGNTWRAATLEGFNLFNDFNYSHLNGEFEDDDENTKENGLNRLYFNKGNLNRDLWKFVVSKMIDNDVINVYEKAVYASLAGFIRPILPLCKNYVDYMWVYFKALYNYLLEKELKLNMPNNLEEQLNYGLNDQVPPSAVKIFDEIRTRILGGENNSLKKELEKPYLIILKNIILSGLHDFDQGTTEILDFIKSIIQEKQMNSGQFLRFSSHLALVFRFAEFKFKADTFVTIQESFVQFLIDYKYKDLVAFYLSHVSSEIQVKLYSKFLQTISDNSERTELLQIAKSLNMNVQEITLNIVENLSKQNKEDDLQTTLLQTTSALSSNKSEFLTFHSALSLNDDDKQKIDSLDWIVNEKSQRVKLLEYGNSIMRHFLLIRQNLEATKQVLQKIPQDTLNVIMVQYKCKSEDDLPIKIINIIKEYICFKEYIEAMSTFNEWFDNHNKRPQKTTTDLQVSSFSDRITQDFHQKQFESLVAQWEFKSKTLCDKALRKFMNVLTFPNGGWMIDQTDNDEEHNTSDEFESDRSKEARQEDKHRHKQMETLRKLFIPYVCFVLCEMLYKMNQHKEVIRLSDIIASEHYKLFELFDPNQLRNLLNKFTDSSIQLVDSKYDIFGYQI